MKPKFLLILFLLCSAFNSFSQSIELGGNFSSSNENFYKNVFGGNVGYMQHFKRQFIFMNYNYAFKNNEYSNFSDSFAFGLIARGAQGTLTNHALKIGVAQKLANTDAVCLAIGILGSLNYFEFDEEVVFMEVEEGRESFVYDHSGVQNFQNRFGIGAFLDMEFRNVLFDRLSIYSRTEVNHVDLIDTSHMPRGIPFLKVDLTRIEFSLGFRYNLNY